MDKKKRGMAVLQPTLKKTVASVLAGLISNYFGMIYFGECKEFMNCYFDSFYKGWYVWLPPLLIIYLLWSILQKE